MVPMERRDSEGVLLLVWGVCDQAFGERCRKAVTWPSRILKICIQTNVEKFTDSKNAILFDLWRKITKLSRQNRFRTVASPVACERLTVLNNDARRQCILLVHSLFHRNARWMPTYSQANVEIVCATSAALAVFVHSFISQRLLVVTVVYGVVEWPQTTCRFCWWTRVDCMVLYLFIYLFFLSFFLLIPPSLSLSLSLH